MPPARVAPVFAVLLGAAALAAGLLGGRALLGDSDFIFLRDETGARWIRHDRPFALPLRPEGTTETGFRKTFRVTEAPRRAVLAFRALRRSVVYVDGAVVHEGREPLDRWKRVREVDLAPYLAPGEHRLRIVVENRDGPALLWARGEGVDLSTDSTWEASVDRIDWTPAAAASEPPVSPVGRAFPRSDRALLSLAPLLGAVFLAVALWRADALRATPRLPSPSAAVVRAGLLAAWLALAANNLAKTPGVFGFDFLGHIEYLRFLLEHHSLPLATDGWKTAEPPLYYLIAAPLFALGESLGSIEIAVGLVRAIGFACGVAQVELGYRVMREVFPQRGDLQAVGTLVAGLIPLNLYLSQWVTNQPLVAALSTLVIWLTLRCLRRGDHALRDALWIGVSLGAAVLAKVTALLLAPPVAAALLLRAWRDAAGRGRRFGPLVAPVAVAGASALAVCGWFFARNLLALGTPFGVGLDPSRGIVWVQDPGFLTPATFTTFGTSLLYPVHSFFASFWDSLYGSFWTDAYLSSGTPPDAVPPWNFRFLAAGALLALVPSLAILAGSAKTIASPRSSTWDGTLLALLWVAVHGIAMLAVYLMVPMAAAGKAAYASNVLAPIGVLAAAGFGSLRGARIADPLFCGAFGCWAIAAYAAYFAT